MAIKSLKSGSYGRSVKAGNSIILPGDYESIATITIGSSATQFIQFTSIPQTYKHLQIRGIGRLDGGGSIVALRINPNGDTAGANYYHHWLYGNGTSALTDSGTYGTAAYLAGNGAGSNMFGSFIIDILDYTNTNKYKTTRVLGGIDQNGSGALGISSNLWKDTSAISSIWLFGDVASFTQYSSFALYGIRG